MIRPSIELFFSFKKKTNVFFFISKVSLIYNTGNSILFINKSTLKSREIKFQQFPESKHETLVLFSPGVISHLNRIQQSTYQSNLFIYIYFLFVLWPHYSHLCSFICFSHDFTSNLRIIYSNNSINTDQNLYFRCIDW
jgi:hypothetical protein